MTVSQRLLLCVGGDLMTGRGIDQVLPHPSPPHIFEPVVTSALDYVSLAERAHGEIPRKVDYSYVWGDALAELEQRRPDARMVNLETSVTTSEDAMPKGVNYRMRPANVPVLTAAKIDCCTLANNHVLDWGQAGLRETLESLTHAGIRIAGAGRDLERAEAPAVLDMGNGRRVLVFACGSGDSGIPGTWAAARDRPGVHRLADLSEATLARFAALVEREKRDGDVAAASIHWGPNWGYDVSPSHRRFAHMLIDRAHIDIVSGHSSHHPKAIEVYHDRPILYGCGDLLNDYEGIRGYEAYRDDLAMLYWLTIEMPRGALERLSMTPFQIHRFRLRHPSAADRSWLLATTDRECRRYGHHVALHDDELTVQWESSRSPLRAPAS